MLGQLAVACNFQSKKIGKSTSVFRYGGDSRNQSWLDNALKSAECMQEHGTPISRDLAHRLVLECAKCHDLEFARRIHSLMLQSGLFFISVLADHLIRLYTSIGSSREANQAFVEVRTPSQYTWNSIIRAHSKIEDGELVLRLYSNMQQQGIRPDKFTFSSALKACGSIHSIGQGKFVHKLVIESGLELEISVGSTLVDMYAKCGSFDESHKVFDRLPARNVVTWGAMISGYAQHGNVRLALKCFERMQDEGIRPDAMTWSAIIAGYVQHGDGDLALECFSKMQMEGLKPTTFTFSSILKACSSIGAIDQGRRIHNQIMECGVQSDVVVGNTLVDMYAKCGDLQEAYKLFDKMPKHDVITWAAMIAGYVHNGEGFPAIECFRNMQFHGIKANKATFLSILKACGIIGALDQGKHIHEQIIENGCQFDTVIGSTLVDMYAKCANLGAARMVISKLPIRDVVAWSAMIAGCAQYGNLRLAEKCLDEMQQEGIQPDEITFFSLLSACSHAGLVDHGRNYFKSMKEDYGIVPDTRHYTCMVDLLGRAGHLHEAMNILEIVQPDIMGWRSLLAACRTYGNVELGKDCFNHIVQLNSQNSAAYTLMSGIYLDACMSTEAIQIEESRHHASAWKKPAKAWIEVEEKVHEFVIGDKMHPQNQGIITMLKNLIDKMKGAGYMPKIELVMEKMSDEAKEDALCGHCEKLAIAFGLISMPAGTSIRVTKNLRVCMDCHDAAKIISKLEKREIVIRDVYRAHHFADGSCSCEDLF